ncbi:MAG: hypothetical protein ACLQGP_32260 [Isosphaeraceae bacterium]
MTEERVAPIRFALSLRQMMKLVVFGAVASMCLAPMWRLAEAGIATWPRVILGEAVAIPMVLAVAAFPLVRKGPNKDRLIRALLATSLSIGLLETIYALNWAAAGPPSLNVWAGSGATPGFFRAVIVVLGIPFVMLSRQVLPGLSVVFASRSTGDDVPAGVPGSSRSIGRRSRHTA